MIVQFFDYIERVLDNCLSYYNINNNGFKNNENEISEGADNEEESIYDIEKSMTNSVIS